ncbi:DUF2293 domain-containing protein [Aureimonas mangrovi]|uniref:DUF2293 domain-containing protein n=1 Tax=Aureimonas mangrovi TaxID=2758041 RepID=UPI00163D7A9F|nr:DUF2293 domain-containing protein [Aureimonas mangrovi]
MAATGRRRAIDRALTALLPRVPYLDAEAIRAATGRRHMRELSVDAALWLATLAHIRHAHTEYDALRDEGYGREEARFFVVEEVNAVLDRWGAGRRLVSEPGPEEAWPD